MSERKFLAFMFIEGLILFILGLCVLILPKLTSLTFGVMLSASFISYGFYKTIRSIVNRRYGYNVLFEIFLGLYIATIGILLLFVPKINLLWLTALIGVYFLLDSIAGTAFVSQIKNNFHFWGCKMFSVGINFLVGLIIVLGIPLMSFWAISTLSAIALVVKGMSKISLNFANRNNYNI